MRRIHSEIMPRETVEEIGAGYRVGIVFRPTGEVRLGDTLILLAFPRSGSDPVWEGIVTEVMWVTQARDCPGLMDGYVLVTAEAMS